MAHQLIATKLNYCNGSNLSFIQSTVNNCDSAIGNLVVPPIGSGFMSPGQAHNDTEALDNYNNGLVPGVANCPTPTTSTTWGAIKTLHR
jgi:hypothetical protein